MNKLKWKECVSTFLFSFHSYCVSRWTWQPIISFLFFFTFLCFLFITFKILLEYSWFYNVNFYCTGKRFIYTYMFFFIFFSIEFLSQDIEYISLCFTIGLLFIHPIVSWSDILDSFSQIHFATSWHFFSQCEMSFWVALPIY